MAPEVLWMIWGRGTTSPPAARRATFPRSPAHSYLGSTHDGKLSYKVTEYQLLNYSFVCDVTDKYVSKYLNWIFCSVYFYCSLAVFNPSGIFIQFGSTHTTLALQKLCGGWSKRWYRAVEGCRGVSSANKPIGIAQRIFIIAQAMMLIPNVISETGSPMGINFHRRITLAWTFDDANVVCNIQTTWSPVRL